MADGDIAVTDDQAFDDHLLAGFFAFLFFLGTAAACSFFDVLADYVDIAAAIAEFISDFRFVDHDGFNDDGVAGQAGDIDVHRYAAELER